MFTLTALAPWAFACVEPGWRLGLVAGIAMLVVLWLVHVVLTRRFVFRLDGVTLSLGGLIVLAALQMVPLPESVVKTLSPTAVVFHHVFRPNVDEALPGEAAVPRPDTMTLSLDPSRTRDSLVLLVVVFLCYAVSRNFIFTKGSFQRLAWVMFANGVLLALVALMQFFSSPKTMVFWTFATEGQVFGPFVCKNHYPFYLSICIGLGLGLLFEEWNRQDRETSVYAPDTRDLLDQLLMVMERFQSPKSVFVLGGLGLMLVSVPFSLSRGGLLSIVAAGGLMFVVAAIGRRFNRGDGEARSPSGGLAIVLMVAVAAGFGAWFGWKPVEERLNTIWKSQSEGVASGARLPLWRDLWTSVEQFPMTGAGAGTTIHLEVMTRTRHDLAWMYYNHAHNDYLEALMEGGVIRLAITLFLVLVVFWKSVAGYVRHRRRSLAPFLLGSFFGLADVALHSFGDFGIHIPAVAILTTVTAAFVMAACDSLERKPEERKEERKEERPVERISPQVVERIAIDGGERIKVRRRVRVAGVSRSRNRSSDPTEIEAPATLTGIPAIVAVMCAVLASGMVVLEGWRSFVVARWGDAAVLAATDYSDSDRMNRAADCIEQAIRTRPDDPTLWNDMAAARFADAFDKTGRAAAAAAGAAAYVAPPEVPSPDMFATHIAPALRAARTARDLCPILPGPHLRLGSFAKSFATAEAPATHFARAKKAAPADADVRFLSGADSLARGNREEAWSDWKESLTRSGSVLPRIVRAVSKPLPPDMQPLPPADLRKYVLPDDPYLYVAAANLLYPDRDDAPPERKEILRAALKLWKSAPGPINFLNWLDWGNTCEELGENTEALAVWRRGVAAIPDSPQLRERLILRLEGDELYEEALPHLEELLALNPRRVDIRDRYDTARHAVRLKAEIEGKK